MVVILSGASACFFRSAAELRSTAQPVPSRRPRDFGRRLPLAGALTRINVSTCLPSVVHLSLFLHLCRHKKRRNSTAKKSTKVPLAPAKAVRETLLRRSKPTVRPSRRTRPLRQAPRSSTTPPPLHCAATTFPTTVWSILTSASSCQVRDRVWNIESKAI